MTASFTPGPWAYRPEQFDDWGVVRAGRYWICQAKDPERLDEDLLNECRRAKTDPWEANARLIAAAPDLLEALVAAKEAVFFVGTPELMDQVNAAIAKAWGLA